MLGVKLEEYWKAIRYKRGLNSTVLMEDIPNRPDQNWVQCDDCLKWRKLPDGIDMNKLPEKWFCRLNPNPQFRRCEEPEEAEDSEDESSACLKIYKQHEKNLKKQQEQKRIQEEEARLRNDALIQQNKDLKRNFVRQLQLNAPSSPRSPSVSLAAQSPLNSASDNMPVISNVMSLSTPKRMKRSLGLTQIQAAKRARTFHDYCSNTPNSPSTSAATSDFISSPLGFADNNDKKVDENDDDETSSGGDDDDIAIDETNSTPRPKPLTFDLSKVKTEESTSEDAVGLNMECSDQTTMKTSTSNDQASITTQTERFIVKAEEDQSATDVECKMSNTTKIIQDPVEVERCKSADGSGLNFAKLEGTIKEKRISFEHPKSDVENHEGTTSTTSKTSLFSNIEIDLMPTHEAQKQQDNLLNLLEATARERDELREQVREKDIKLLKLTVSKDYSHQSIQTDPSEEQHYKTLYLQATQRIKELTEERDEIKKKEEVLLQIKAEKEAQDEVRRGQLKAEGEGHSSTTNDFENVDDEMALQVDFLLRELDKRNTECNELRSKLDSLEQEKTQLQKEVEELRKYREEWSNAKVEKETLKNSTTSSNQTCSTSTAANPVNGITKEEESNERPVEGKNAETLAKLRELRCSIGRLLVTFVPALELDQVNYDCDVIDEILNQVIQEIPPS